MHVETLLQTNLMAFLFGLMALSFLNFSAFSKKSSAPG